MEKLIASSNTASDKYTKAGLSPKQTGQNAIKQYQLVFNQIKTWVKAKSEFTTERIFELHAILCTDVSGSGVLPPIALPYSLMRHLCIFSYLTEEGYQHFFSEISQGKDPYGVSPVTLSPAIIADVYRESDIDTWAKERQDNKHI